MDAIIGTNSQFHLVLCFIECINILLEMQPARVLLLVFWPGRGN